VGGSGEIEGGGGVWGSSGGWRKGSWGECVGSVGLTGMGGGGGDRERKRRGEGIW